MSQIVTRQANRYLYRQVADIIRDMQHNGTLKVGDRIPSLRQLADTLNISVPTVKQAYEELERIGLVISRPKSGYFLSGRQVQGAVPRKPKLAARALPVSRQQLIEEIHGAVHTPGTLPFGICNPVAALPSNKALARTMRRVMSMAGEQAIGYGAFAGFEPLRRQLAYRYLQMGMQVDPAQIVITNGAQEALTISLKMLAKPGDVIAVESPCYFGILELIESLGMLVYEIPVCSQKGLSLQDIEQAVSQHPIKACVFSTTITNPMGSVLDEASKEALVELLESKGIGLIEDDVYGDLYFGDKRGLPAQIYSTRGLVLSCSSFSKTAAPSYRVGWLLAPNFSAQGARLKRALSCSASLLNQWTLSEYIGSGEYDRYLKQLRQVLHTNKERMSAKVQQHFVPGTRLSNPGGGAVLWLELPRKLDGSLLFRQALNAGISLMPGTLFAASDKYRHCIRLSYGLPWNDKVEAGIVRLGELSRG
ncbi:aminotransferase-like domain-containing protein [Bowmanella dokdonensis]|uniref:PLP-dependent aminotransferase family protein n=1 Tax=Bowmanella dokdonensis TaxID=751969 RepID=A0A939INM0_9ALTE|nr:PLP-dependent aminotransferase family protein [Bowmanella dokdonensis]MBN7824970.1 PLP-dependent aminotransferase family protein [Bowmanella dokdonensis]